MTALGVAAPPLSRSRIRRLVAEYRSLIGVDEHPFIPVVEILERRDVLGAIAPGFDMRIGDAEEMGENHGLTYSIDREIVIREDIYERACAHFGRDRMTIAHEIGHAALHADLPYTRRLEEKVKTFQDPEWQASAFGGELLVNPQHLGQFATLNAMADGFGVTVDALRIQLRAFERDGIVWNEQGGPAGNRPALP